MTPAVRSFALSLVCGVLCAAIPQAAWAVDQGTAGAPAKPESSAVTAERARAVHVLNRLTFGPRPGEVDRVLQVGIDRWIERQLRPESIIDHAGARALDGCPIWTDSIDNALLAVNRRITNVSMRTGNDGVTRQVMTVMTVLPGLALIPRDSTLRRGDGQKYLENGQLIACRLARVEASDQQLLEVMTNFWENHFSLYARFLPSRGFVVEWDRVVLRPNALGRFRDLLGAVAHSPAMLDYLDNDASSVNADQPSLPEYLRNKATGSIPTALNRRGLNENYARELLELHTMGVDAGYTQQDVIEVARAFTGWTHTGAWRKADLEGMRFVTKQPRLVKGQTVDVPGFLFDTTMHDAGAKLVLGHTLAPGQGMEDGEQVLDILARQPSTARHIARKLVIRFVSDVPPEALVERAATTFMRTDGDIREVMRTIVTSPEFFSPAVYGAKVKSPLELVLSTRRALAAEPDTAAEIIDLLIRLDQTPFNNVAPDGWPETGAEWLNAGSMMKRMDLALNIGRGQLPSIPVESWPAWPNLSTQPFDRQVDGVLRTLLNGQASPAFRDALLATRPAKSPTTPAARQQSLRELIALALGSPAFQRR